MTLRVHLVAASVLVGSASLLQPVPVSAQQVRGCEDRTSVNEGFCYLRELTGALEAAHRTALVPVDTAGASSLLEIGSAILYSGEQRRRGMAEAIRALRPFQSSRDSLIREAASETISGLALMMGWSAKSDSTLRAVLNGDGGGVGDQADATAKSRAQRKDAAWLIALAAAAATYTVIEPDPAAPDKRSRLALNDDELRVLLLTRH